MALNLGSSAVSLYLGSQSVNAYLGGTLVTPPAGDPFATLVSTQSTGDVYGYARSTTGYIKAQWWDATTNVYGTGAAGNNITWGLKAAGGAGSKTIRVYPSDVNGNLSGSLTALNCDNISLTSLDVSGLTALTYLSCYYNSLTSLDVSGLTALTTLFCTNNPLTSLDVSGLTALTTLFCTNCSLTSLRAQNVGFSGGYYHYWGVASDAANLSYNQLGAAALDQFYTDLAAGDSPLLVFDNPGTTGDDPSIATAKGYTVYGS